MAALYLLPVKGLINKNEDKQGAGAAAGNPAPPDTEISVNQLVEQEKKNIDASLLVEIEEIEEKLTAGTGDTALLKELATQWAALNVSHVSGLYWYRLAEASPSLTAWMRAGDQLKAGYKTTRDSTQRQFIIRKAQLAYQQALELNPGDLDAKTGLGTVLVEGTPDPMKGIQMLLKVVEEDPENVKANLTLGMFSIQTGQYDKALERLLTVIRNEPSGEAYFYLAEAYRASGDKEKAVEAYQKTKEFIVDPRFTEAIDKMINELK